MWYYQDKGCFSGEWEPRTFPVTPVEDKFKCLEGEMLDTNIVIYVIKRRPIEVLDVFNAHAGQMCISSITLAELLHGAEKSTMVSHNLRRVEDFVSRLEVLPYGDNAAAHYGNIRADLEKKGPL